MSPRPSCGVSGARTWRNEGSTRSGGATARTEPIGIGGVPNTGAPFSWASWGPLGERPSARWRTTNAGFRFTAPWSRAGDRAFRVPPRSADEGTSVRRDVASSQVGRRISRRLSPTGRCGCRGVATSRRAGRRGRCPSEISSC
jgi:hypothetical protein